MITYNNAPVLIIPYSTPFNETKFNITDTWKISDNIYPASKDFILLNTTSAKIYKYIQDNTKSINNTKSNYKLHFTPSSKFPRYKLLDTKFSRCLTPNKADYIVIGPEIGSKLLNYTSFLYKGKDNYYLLRTCNIYFYSSTVASERLFKTNPKQFIEKYKSKIFPEEVKFAIDCTDYELVYGFGKAIDLFINNTPVNIITDMGLDKIINSNYEALTPDTYKTICDMLDSSDDTTKGLGLKMLSGFDVSKTPNAVRFMLGIRENKIRYLNEWSSVGVEQVKKSIGWRGFGAFPYRMYNIVPRDKDPITDEDKLLIKDTYKNACEFYLNNAIDELRNSGFVDKFGFSISYEIKG